MGDARVIHQCVERAGAQLCDLPLHGLNVDQNDAICAPRQQGSGRKPDTLRRPRDQNGFRRRRHAFGGFDCISRQI
jgi:hypothetical protein